MPNFRPLNALEVSRRNSTLGFLPWGSSDASVIVQEPFDLGLVDDTNITETGSGAVYSDGVSLAGGGNGLKIDFSASGLNEAGNLDSGFQIRFEIAKEYLCFYDVSNSADGHQPTYTSETILSWNEEGVDAQADNRSLFRVSGISAGQGNKIQLIPEGSSSREAAVLMSAFDDPYWATVHIWGDGTYISVAVDGQLMVDAIQHGLAASAWSFMWIGTDRGYTTTGNASFGTTEPNRFKIRRLQVSTATPTFGSLPSNYIGFVGDSFVDNSKDEYAAIAGGGFRWSGVADVYNGRFALQLRARLRMKYGIDFNPYLYEGGGGHFMTGSISPPLYDDLATYKAENCHFHVLQLGTNDATETDGAPIGFELWMHRVIDDIMSTANSKGLVIGTIPSLTARNRSTISGDSYDTSQYREQVATLNAIIARAPAWWDETYPTKRGRVVVADTFAALGGENGRERKVFLGQSISTFAAGTYGDDSNAPSGQLGKLDWDIHPNAYGSMLMLRDAYLPALEGLIQRFG